MAHKVKILFVLKKRGSYGISYGLVNSCKFVSDALADFGIKSKIVQVEDNNGIDKEVHDYKPTHVFIEALWVVPEKFEVLLPRYPKVKWYVRLHSQAPFLGYEGVAFEWIKKYGALSNKFNNFKISSNSTKLIKSVKPIGIEMVYTPNIYLFDKVTHTYLKDGKVDVGCFGAIRPFKNHINQALASVAFAEKNNLKLSFHINASRFENLGESILKNLRAIFNGSKHELVEHDWSNHNDFINLVKKMDLGLQVSYTETFNIVAADFVSNNIPLVGSKEIEWLSSFFQADPNDVEDIKNKLDFAYKSRSIKLQRLNESKLNSYNDKAIDEWLELLNLI